MAKRNVKNAEDKIIQYYYKSVDYYEKNKNRVYTILGIVVLIVVVIFIYFRNLSSQAETASLELSKTSKLYTSGDFMQAINGDSLGQTKGLLYIVDNYGSTESGETAKIMLANCYYNLRDFDSAEKYYKDYSGKNDMLKATSIAGIASVMEAKGQYNEAGEYFEKASAISKDISLNDEYLYNAARNFFLSKNTENLKKTIKELKKEYPKSKYITQLSRYEPVN